MDGRSDPPHSPAQAGHDPVAAQRTRSTSRAMPGSNRTDVPAGTASRCPQAASRSNVERRVGLGEVVVRADLHRPVAGVDAPRSCRTGRPALISTGRSPDEDLARDELMGSARAR